MSLSDYLRTILEAAAVRPTPQELADRIRIRGRVDLPEPSERIVRQISETRG